MDWTLWGSLVAFTLAGGVTPGPNNIILMSMGLTYGFKKCLPYIAGVAVGFALLLASAILGLGAVIEVIPGLMKIVTLAGALWLSWLAFGYARAAMRLPKTPKTLPGSSVKPLGFFHSIAFQWVNPKGLIFAIGAAASFTQLHDNLWIRIVIIVATFNLAGLIGNVAWAAAGSSVNALISNGRWSRLINTLMAAVIFATAAFIVHAGFTAK